jgi:hypothetical protein
MENNRLFPRIVCAVVCLLFGDCAASHEPSRWLSDPDKVPVDPYGAWIEVKTDSGRVDGEFIAVSPDSVYVANTSLQAVNRNRIASARVVVYNSNDVSAGLILGPLLTISNGWYLIFTAPMWMIGGTIATISRSYEPVFDYPAKSFGELTRYARFPRGLPPEVDRGGLKMKQVEKRKS